MHPRLRLRFPLAVAAATVAALFVAGPASAHIDTDPPSVQAGTANTVGFIVKHGCDGSPTVKVEIEMPDGATGIKGVDGAGFKTTVAGQVVTFAGGSLPDDTEQAFKVTFTAPATAGDLPVKLIQTCTVGSLEWISLEESGQPEPEHPAPILKVTPAGATTTTEAEHDEESPTTTTTVAVTPTTTTTAESDSDSDNDSSTPYVIGGIAALAVVGGGGALYARSRNQTP